MKLEKTLYCCMKDLWGQRSGWGTLTSYILSTPCNNIIFICLVINSFNTSLVTYCHWIHSGRNINEVMIFFRKHEPTLKSLNVRISNKKITNFVQRNSIVCSACVWLWACWCLLSSTCISVIWFHHIKLEKPYLVAWRIYEVKGLNGVLWLVTFWRPYVTTKSLFV